jgi:hypothetical protein
VAAAAVVLFTKSGLAQMTVGAGSFVSGSVDVRVNKRTLTATLIDKHAWIDLRVFYETLGATVSYDVSQKLVTVRRGGSTVKLQVGKRVANIDGKTVTMERYPVLRNGQVAGLLRFAAESLGAKVSGDGQPGNTDGRRIIIVR